MKTQVIAVCTLLALVACGGDDDAKDDGPKHVPPTDAGPPPDPGTDAEAPPPDGGPAIRTVVTRSPFGDLSASKSYLLDGDFEFSMTGNVVPAWYVVTKQNELGTASFQTGGQCASGTLCIVLGAGESLLTYDLTAPPQAKLTASFRAKPASGKCTDASAALFLYDTQADGDTFEVTAKAADAPDASGWCTLTKEIETSGPHGTGVMQITAKKDVVIDGVALMDAAAGNPGTKRSRVRPASPTTLRWLKELGRKIHEREQAALAKPKRAH